LKRLVIAVSLALVLSGATLMTSALPVRAAACTPNWQTVQSQSIFSTAYYVYVYFGSVSLQRDGCGDIRGQLTAIGDGRAATAGSLTITNVDTNTIIFTSTNLQGHGLVGGITSPIFSGYGGVGITVSGSLTEPSYGTITATTTPDHGS
jgi:hypothetical protein